MVGIARSSVLALWLIGLAVLFGSQSVETRDDGVPVRIARTFLFDPVATVLLVGALDLVALSMLFTWPYSAETRPFRYIYLAVILLPQLALIPLAMRRRRVMPR